MADSHDTIVLPDHQPGGRIVPCPTRRRLLAAVSALGGATEAFPATAATGALNGETPLSGDAQPGDGGDELIVSGRTPV